MTDVPQNPLQQYFRSGSKYIKLPSCGFFNDVDNIQFTIDGEIEVYPMTTADELLFKSPDALLNGDSVAKVIQSCVPGIKNVRQLPINDIEILLLSIHLATYDHQIDFTSPCPNCENQQEFGVDIGWLLENMQTLEPNISVTLKNGLIINIKPYTYESSVKAALLAFNEGKFLQMLMEEDLSDEDKTKKAAISYQKAIDLTIDLLSNSIISIQNDQQEIISEDQIHILEFLDNTSSGETKIIQEKIAEINLIGIPRELEVSCDKCSHKWTTAVNIDPSHFFV
jgi:hypothetical protein